MRHYSLYNTNIEVSASKRRLDYIEVDLGISMKVMFEGRLCYDSDDYHMLGYCR